MKQYPTPFSSNLNLFWKNKHLSLYIPTFHYYFLLIYQRSGHNLQLSEVLSILRLKSNFLIVESSYSAILVARKKGSTVHAPLSNITCSMRYA